MLTITIILGVTILLFIWGKFTPDIIAVLSMLALYLSGVLNLDEALSGFSNPMVIMIASLFIIGEALSHTGWTALIGKKLIEIGGKKPSKLLMFSTLGAGILSGFVSNTGTVATLLPVTISSAWSIGSLPSKMLIPMAFGSNTGGLLTLTGTPPNIIASISLEEAGFIGFSFFEFALIGLPLLLITVLYFKYIGHKFLPTNSTNNKPVNIESTLYKWIDAYKIDGDYYRLRIRSMSPLINTQIKDWDLSNNFNVSIIRLKRRHPNILNGILPFIEFPEQITELRYHDIITVKGETEDINRFMIKFRLGLLPLEPIKDELRHNLINQEVGMAEVLVTPKSRLVGRSLKIGYYFRRYKVQLMAASRNNKPFEEQDIKVKAGDAFIIRGTWESIEALNNEHEHLVICGSPEGLSKDVTNLNYKSYIALGVLVLLIILIAGKVVPGAIAALICSGILIVTKSISITKAYKGISWISVVMIAAMIPMGLALQKTGTAKAVADQLVNSLGTVHPILLMAGIFILTTTFSQVINNSATAVLMAPIVIVAASTLGISPKPLMITVAISASTAFLTPVGTTTNAMVMTAGGYKFMDYFKVGLPLLILFLIITLFLVPIIWPF